MKHYGDITKLSGATLPAVDVITGGSPCQDLSVAGKRAGMAGERSGLFMEQIRIVKEMRYATGKPRYMVWENVPGAFSSNHGADFQTVLTEIVRIVKADAPDVPLPKGGRWAKSGCLMGRGDNGQYFSIAWRLHDAQFWGVPQRRKRIALVADFGGLSAPEILFERKGLQRHSDKSQPARKETAGNVGKSAEATDIAISFQERAGKPGGGKGILIQDEHTGALSTVNNQSVYCLQGGGATSLNSQGDGINEGVSFTLNAVDRHGVAYGFKPQQGSKAHGMGYEEEKAPTLNTTMNAGVLCLNDQGGSLMNIDTDISGTLRAQANGHQPIIMDD